MAMGVVGLTWARLSAISEPWDRQRPYPGVGETAAVFRLVVGDRRVDDGELVARS